MPRSKVPSGEPSHLGRGRPFSSLVFSFSIPTPPGLACLRSANLRVQSKGSPAFSAGTSSSASRPHMMHVAPLGGLGNAARRANSASTAARRASSFSACEALGPKAATARAASEAGKDP